jgi:hypothetical protein
VVSPQIGVELKIFIVTRSKTNITVTYPTGAFDKLTIPADSVHVINVSNFYYNDVSEVVKRNAIDIVTDVPVVVYSFNSQAHTSDSYVCIPVSNWGDKYAVMSMPNDQYNPVYEPPTRQDSLVQYTPRASEFLLIAGYDNTYVTIRPTALTEKAKQIGNYYQVVLNKGETYLVKSFPTPKGYGDLTGTFIQSTKPLGVLSGHVRSSIPQNLPAGKDSKDHLVEQLTQLDSWGSLYFSVPFGVNVDGDLFRVMSREPNTKVKIYTASFPTEYVLPDSLFTRSFSNINQPAIWQSDKPIQIAQFMQRRGIDPESKEFDPAMVMLPPREQFVQKVLFTTPGGVFYNPNQYTGHFVSLVAEEAAIRTLMLDDVLIDTVTQISSQRIINTNLFWVVIPLAKGTHQLSSTTGKFSGILYGVGEFDSYAMVLGASLVRTTLEDLMAPIIDARVRCFDIAGETYDFDTKNSSGLNFAKVDEMRTYNYNWTIFPTEPNDTIVRFTARVANRALPGKFVLESFDKSGNKNLFVYDYEPLDITSTSILDFGQVSWLDSLCMDFVIQNTGSRTAYLDSIKLPTDARVKIYHSINAPDSLLPGEAFRGRLCFTPKQAVEVLKSEIIAYFHCDIIERIPVLGEVVAPALVARGWDFGNVYVGDSAKHTIEIENIGNIPLRIDSLYFFDENTAFTYGNLNILPTLIQPGEKYQAMVTFKPTRRDVFIASLRFANHLRMNNKVFITGKGVAPLFTDYILDFGRKRVGTQNESTISIMNDGNIASELKFKEFSEKLADDQNSAIIQNIKNNIDALDRLPLKFTYIPADTGSYVLSARLICDWNLHPEINLKLLGKGTIPVCKTYNYDFGNVKIFSINNANPKLIEDTGNEDLTIDEVKVISGDAQSFTIDYNALKSIILPIGRNQLIPVNFNPKKLGKHTLILGVINDAMPNYQRRMDTIVITGFADPPDILSADLRIEGDGNYSVCNYDTIYAVFQNPDAFPIQITDIDLSFTPGSVDAESMLDYQSLLPITILDNSLYKLPIKVLLYANESVTCSVKALFNNGNERTASLTINPNIYSVTILNNNDLEVSPKDSVRMNFNGSFGNSSQVPVKFDLQLKIDKEVLYLITEKPVLEVVSYGFTNIIPLKYVQQKDKIIFSWDANPILIDKNNSWKLDLTFLTLLSTKSLSDVQLTIDNYPCYLGAANGFKAIVQEICVNNNRPIQVLFDEPIVNIFPNPVKNILKIDLDLPKNSYFYISIFDIFGKEYLLDKNLFLSKGKYLLIYEVEKMTNGKYYLKVVINNKVEYKNINIIR